MNLPAAIAGPLKAILGKGLDVNGLRIKAGAPSTVVISPTIKVTQTIAGIPCSGRIGRAKVFSDRIELEVQTLLGTRTETVRL